MERNRAFDFLKLCFTAVIVLHHSHYLDGALNRGYIPVEFFFILSGFFIAQACQTRPEQSVWQYFKTRAWKLYPEYWFAFLLLLAKILITGAKMPYPTWYAPILDLLMMQNLGIPGSGGMNYPAWYLSVLMFGGLLIYCLRKRLTQKLFNIIACLVVAITYLFLAANSRTVEQWNTVAYVLYVPFWRGMADMFIGTLLFQMPIPSKIWGRMLECLSLLGVLLLLHISGPYDYLAVVLIVLLVYAVRTEGSWLQKVGSFPPVKCFYRYQYGVYLNHALVISLFGETPALMNLDWKLRVVALVVAVTLVSTLGMGITRKAAAVIQRNAVGMFDVQR